MTELGIKNLVPNGSRYLVYDEVVPGFVVSVEPSGHKAFKLLYRSDNRPRWLTIAPVAALALAEARQMARDSLADVYRGRDPAAEKRKRTRGITLRALAEKYATYAATKNRSAHHSAKRVEKHALSRLGKRIASSITRADIREMHQKITVEAGPSSADVVLALTSAIFDWAIKQEVIDIAVNPCHGIERNGSVSRERVLSDREIKSVWDALGEHDLGGVGAKLVLVTGQRPIEIRHMRAEHIDDRVWRLPGKPDDNIRWPGTKNGRDHRVILSDLALKLLAETPLPDVGFVWGTAWPLSTFDGAMRDVSQKLGLNEPARPHDLRRTFGTLVTRLGFSRAAMDRLLNHADGGVGSVYDRHGYDEEDGRIWSAVDEHIVATLGQNRRSNG